jgi:single-stranded-DNA-specific exonuclease
LRANANLFTAFGGHAMAGGCSFLHENFAAVRDALCIDVLACLLEEHLRPAITPDAAIDVSSATLALADGLAVLEPFGAENREPLFLIENVPLAGVRRIGTDGKHLQARIGTLGVVGFGLGDVENAVPESVDVVCRVTANEWNGSRKPQLSIVDIREAVVVTTDEN